jgi:hypothetical protein
MKILERCLLFKREVGQPELWSILLFPEMINTGVNSNPGYPMLERDVRAELLKLGEDFQDGSGRFELR